MNSPIFTIPLCKNAVANAFYIRLTVIHILSAVTAIDTSGIDTLSELRKMLEKRLLQVRVW